MEQLLTEFKKLSDNLEQLNFSPPVEYIYNPLNYAWEPFENYLRRYSPPPKEVLMVGMNPGPWGMVQTGIPFGEILAVRDWMKLSGNIGLPKKLHPKRPVLGWKCTRREVSGRRLWGWAQQKFQTPENFFSRFFIANYCPLCFFDSQGSNLTPDKLKGPEKKLLFQLCDQSLQKFILFLRPKFVVGIGTFAFNRIKASLKGLPNTPKLAKVIHPSPANPLANESWGEKLTELLLYMGVKI